MFSSFFQKLTFHNFVCFNFVETNNVSIAFVFPGFSVKNIESSNKQSLEREREA
jgi:hypothetical protein